MPVFKCKMCGGQLEFEQGATTCECSYCGTLQTVSKSSDDYIQNLFGRANNFRSKCEFDKAEDTYTKILDKDDTEAEAHWGIVLCKYGIEYVDDPATGKKIPTCHRTLFEPITTDPDYQAAVKYADAAQLVLYEQEAKYIDKVQKDILAIVKNEKPFDVFICYKESDDGMRTQDSVIANDIYYQLTQEGFKVFYAAITLEDKIGAEYEPYIFAALNSAKVMLVLGTKPEYFTAVWVKNEWSRFMKLMKTDRTKQLFPCYRDMDAYDLPDEFSHLQAQDMSKIGFINDLVRGIKKVLNGNNGTETSSTSASVAQAVAQADNIAPLITRMKNFVDGNEYDKAFEYSERILDIDPDNFDANFYAVIAGRKLNKTITTFAKQLNRLFDPASEAHTKNININSENASDVFIDFAYSQAYSVCDFIAEKYPDIHKATYKDDKNVYHSMLAYVIVKVKDKAIVDILLKHGADPNSYRIYNNQYGSTQYSVLSDAIWNIKNLDMVKLLLEHGADANRLEQIVHDDGSKEEKSMLTRAIIDAENVDMVKALLEHGADPNSYRVYNNQYGNTQYSALSDAIWNAENFEMVKLLLEHGADANRLEQVISDSGKKAAKSMLTYAIIDAKNADMVKALLEHGADPNSYRTYNNQHGSTQCSALSDAIWNAKNPDMVKLLLEHGADANRLEQIVTDKGKKGAKSMLTYAIVDAKNADMVKALLEHGADPNSYRTYNNQHGSTQYSALSDAIWKAKNPDMVKLLLEHGADANRLEQIVYDDGSKGEKSMLTRAIKDAENVDMVKALLEHGADPNSYRTYNNQHGSTQYSALSDAIWNAKNPDMVKLLLEHGADANRLEQIVYDSGKKSAKSMLTYAIADAKNADMVKALLEHGADPNSYRINNNQHGSTQYSALGDAIWNAKNPDMVKLLLEHGADANRLEQIVYDSGKKGAKSMLTYAIVDAKNADMVRMLFAHGATLENTILYGEISKVERKYPYHKNNRTTEAVLAVLREHGWRGDKLF